MRLLIISAAYPPNPGGVATHVANLAHGLARRGSFDVSVLASTEDTGLNAPRTYKNGNLVIWKLLVNSVPSFSGRRAPCNDVLDFALRHWPQIRPDLIHAHDFDSVQVGSTLKAAFGKRLVATIHRAPSPWRQGKIVEQAKDCYLEAMRHYRFADMLVVPCQSSRDVLVDQRFKRALVRIIPHGIRTKYLASFSDCPEILQELGLRAPRDLILCPVRADSHKDPWTFVRAAGMLKKLFPRRHLLFLVTCQDPSLESLAREWGLELRADIHFRSFPRTAMPTLYRRAKVCVVPSRRESFGQTVLESFVFKTPVVAANTTALREIVVNRHNGLLFTDGDHQDLAEQVGRILDNPEIGERMAFEALQLVRTKYDADRMVDDYCQLYRELLPENT